MINQYAEIRALPDRVVDVRHDHRNSLRSSAQCVCTGFLESNLVVVDTSHETIQHACHSHAAFHVRHVCAAMQCMTRTIQFVRYLKWWLMTNACIQIIFYYQQVTRGFLAENIEQDRIHFECRFFLFGCRLWCREREHSRIWIAICKRV